MIIGLKCYLSLAFSFGILTFFWNLLVSEILKIFIKILSESEAHNAYKIYAEQKRCIVSIFFYFCDSLINLKDLLFRKKNFSFWFRKFISRNLFSWIEDVLDI